LLGLFTQDAAKQRTNIAEGIQGPWKAFWALLSSSFKLAGAAAIGIISAQRRDSSLPLVWGSWLGTFHACLGLALLQNSALRQIDR
jgi:hypothetical protein